MIGVGDCGGQRTCSPAERCASSAPGPMRLMAEGYPVRLLLRSRGHRATLPVSSSPLAGSGWAFSSGSSTSRVATGAIEKKCQPGRSSHRLEIGIVEILGPQDFDDVAPLAF